MLIYFLVDMPLILNDFLTEIHVNVVIFSGPEMVLAVEYQIPLIIS